MEQPRLKEINSLKLLSSTSRKTHKGETTPPPCNEIDKENVVRQLYTGTEVSFNLKSLFSTMH